MTQKTVDYLTFKCDHCGKHNQYYPKDLQMDYDGPDSAPDYYVECRDCGYYIGNYESLKEWIDQLPEMDYEPDPDVEYERAWLNKQGMP